MKIILQGTPPSLNRFAGRMNSWEYREEKERWTRAVHRQCAAERLKSSAGRRLTVGECRDTPRGKSAAQAMSDGCEGTASGAAKQAGAGGKAPADGTAKDFARVRIDYYFADSRRRDPDNYCGKLLLDGLTRAGAIADDDFSHIALEVRGHVDRENPRTEITVEAEG